MNLSTCVCVCVVFFYSGIILRSLCPFPSTNCAGPEKAEETSEPNTTDTKKMKERVPVICEPTQGGLVEVRLLWWRAYGPSICFLRADTGSLVTLFLGHGPSLEQDVLFWCAHLAFSISAIFLPVWTISIRAFLSLFKCCELWKQSRAEGSSSTRQLRQKKNRHTE